MSSLRVIFESFMWTGGATFDAQACSFSQGSDNAKRGGGDGARPAYAEGSLVRACVRRGSGCLPGGGAGQARPRTTTALTRSRCRRFRPRSTARPSTRRSSRTSRPRVAAISPGRSGTGCAPRRKGRLIASLAANGDLDAVVDVYHVQRSQLTAITCAATNSKGKAELAFGVKAGDTYLVRVSQQKDSAADSFQLVLEQAAPAAAPPGPPLPRGGASGTLDPVRNPSFAYSIPMSEGVTYRFHMAAGDKCTPFAIYPPGTRNFSRRTPVRELSCGGYTLFTPRGGKGGVYSLLVRTPRYGGRARFLLDRWPRWGRRHDARPLHQELRACARGTGGRRARCHRPLPVRRAAPQCSAGRRGLAGRFHAEPSCATRATRCAPRPARSGRSCGRGGTTWRSRPSRTRRAGTRSRGSRAR